MEAPNVCGKFTELDLADFGFHIDDLLNISNEEIAGPIGDDDNNNCSSDNTKCAGDETEQSSSRRCRSPLYGSYDAETGEHYTLACSDDLAELEWLSNFVEDSFSMANGAAEPPNPSGRGERLPNNNNEEIGSSAGPEMCSSTVPVRARSKRPRRPPVSNWYNSHILLLNIRHSAPELETDGHPNHSSSFSAKVPKNQSSSGAEIAVPEKKFADAKPYGTLRLKKKKTQDDHGQAVQATRRCAHCAIHRTPQWRAGPSGPKTLCNACGVRYKSGRLFPEYRPAASPTFVHSQHSNSHKRVLQMRRQKFESQIDEEPRDKFAVSIPLHAAPPRICPIKLRGN